MPKRALLQGKRIVQFVPLVADQFPVAPGLEWVGVPHDTAEKDFYIGGRVIKWQAPVPVEADVIRERERRFALGFDHDLGDGRGVHRIGTTEQDMKGWREITDYATALADKGDTSTTIVIVTDTGPCTVTALEWADIRIAAAAFRQPIWGASFVIAGLDPIPTDYTDDGRWP